MIEKRTEAITLKGTPADLAGSELKIGDATPGFILQNNALEDVTLVGQRLLAMKLACLSRFQCIV